MTQSFISRNSTSISKDVKTQFTVFLQTWKDNHSSCPYKYVRIAKKMIQNGKHLMEISNKDFLAFDSDLSTIIFEDFYRYQPHLNKAVTHFIHEQEQHLALEQSLKRDETKEKYSITFESGISHENVESVRDLKCSKLGKLISFRGTVTRTTEVKPELITGVFQCKECGTYSRPVHQQFKYTQPKKCLKTNCDKKSWELNLPKSQFADFQKLRVQEDPAKIPPGAMPRSVDVIIRDDNTEKGQPGDICQFIGYLCVLPQIASMLKPGEKMMVNSRTIEARGNLTEMEGVTGIKGIKQLSYKLIFIGTNIIIENDEFRETYEDNDDYQEKENEQKQKFTEELVMEKAISDLNESEVKMIKQLKDNPNLYEDMASSLFPSIFGQSQIKKALLLQLFSGIHKITSNKISIRGDINILIVGDPSTAKSQFLKTVNKFVPRSVYTNGKTTSAAGLTASVIRDQNGTVGIEAGALMLADNGICCIDEFDKMELKDQVAIHEAMQQQTISLAKAGVYATLNARTSILAAANPLFGRYNKSKSLKHNINISAPIMSRFDLFFIICDEVNENADSHLAEFVIKLHQHKEKALNIKYTTKQIKQYMSIAKKLKPILMPDSCQLLRKYYVDLRGRDKTTQNNSYRITVRQLQSMIRLSEAYARLHLDQQIKPTYVMEAYRLLSASLLKLQKSPIEISSEFMEEDEERNNMKKLLIEKQLKMKEEKKNKNVSISHQFYQQILKNTLKTFEEEETKNKDRKDEVRISVQSLSSCLIAMNFQSGMINTQEETRQMKKIINAVIKKLIKEERMLVVVEDSPDPTEKMLKIHPNYVH